MVYHKVLYCICAQIQVYLNLFCLLAALIFSFLVINYPIFKDITSEMVFSYQTFRNVFMLDVHKIKIKISRSKTFPFGIFSPILEY